MPNVKQTKDGLMEKSTGRKIESPLDTAEQSSVRFSDSPNDDLLIAHVINIKTDHEYKIYANGKMTGFDSNCICVNRFLKYMLILEKRFRLSDLAGGHLALHRTQSHNV